MKKETKEAYQFYIAAIARGEQPKVADIAKRFKCDRVALAMRISRSLKKNDEKAITANIENGFKNIAVGITQIQTEIETANKTDSELTRALISDKISTGFEYLDKFGYLGKYSLNLLAKTLQKGEELLKTNTNTTFEYQAVANGLKKTIETLGMFKTAPQIAIQNNLINGKNGNNPETDTKKNINIKIDIVKPKSDIIEAEVLENE